MKVEYIAFTERAVRSRFIAQRFKAYLQGRILDVGCDQAVLKTLLPACDYLGIDVAGQPDRVVNLEHIDRLPFDSASFDCVVCADVLEHLDNLHQVFDELVRVARRYLILSLPNNWANARRAIARGRGHVGHYGLPPEPPLDRHKWFFSLEEAHAFFEGQARRHRLGVCESLATEKPRAKLIRVARRVVHASQMRYLNRFAHTLWTVLGRPR
ncbi:MAG: class I SAM-dependent methyltransferase [Verrucomicrobia bacterium]|nr:class I SAM-dependent methyltransferase [Verrucomicrobiota bacterium]